MWLLTSCQFCQCWIIWSKTGFWETEINHCVHFVLEQWNSAWILTFPQILHLNPFSLCACLYFTTCSTVLITFSRVSTLWNPTKVNVFFAYLTPTWSSNTMNQMRNDCNINATMITWICPRTFVRSNDFRTYHVEIFFYPCQRPYHVDFLFYLPTAILCW